MRHPLRMFYDDIAMKPGTCDPYDNIILGKFFFDIYNLYITSIRWINLPDIIEPFYIENVMFWDGIGIFVRDDILNVEAFMKIGLGGIPDIYAVPSERWGYTPNGMIGGYDKSNSVILRDTYSTFPYCFSARIHAYELFHLYKTKLMNVKAQRTPIVILSTDDQKLTYQIIGEQYDNYLPYIKVDDSINLDRITTLNIGAPFIVPGLESEYRQVMSTVLSEIGYSNNPELKREREITMEASLDNGVTEGFRNCRLAMRQRACEGLKLIWNRDVQVEFNTEIPIYFEPQNKPSGPEGKEVDTENEQVHDNNQNSTKD